MLKQMRRLFAALLITLPLGVSAIQLDCKDNGDGTYTCVEIKRQVKQPAAFPAATADEPADIDRASVEQAEKECSYRKPHRRVSGMSTGTAVKMEGRKSAQKDYDRCVAQKLKAMKNAAQ